MKDYYRVMLGAKSIYAEDAFKGNFIGADFGIDQDLSGHLPDDWREFNKTFIPVYLTGRPGKTKVAAGLACGTLWTVCKGIQNGDIVLSPNGAGQYLVGEVVGDYSFHQAAILPHRRTVRWLAKTIDRSDMSPELQNSAGTPATACMITKHAAEIERLLAGTVPVPPGEEVENPVLFVFEKYLEDFLVKNWQHTVLGKDYDIYEEDGVLVGQQYPSDTGPIDILAISKDRQELLVIELKRGRASDAVVGQIQRYMGFVLEDLAEKHQRVKGVIIALEDDLRIRRALAVASNIEFYRYEMNFKLFKS